MSWVSEFIKEKKEPSKEVPERKTVEWLSDLCVGFSPVGELSEEHVSKLRKLGAEFFGDADQLMVNEPGNTPELQLDAIFRFAVFLEKLWRDNFSFADHTSCPEAGKLEYYARWYAGGTCYDGGCYSDEPDECCYYILRRISNEEYDEKKESRRTLYKDDSSRWSCNAALPGADRTEVFEDSIGRLYLKNPMDILGCFVIEYDRR